MTPPSCRQPLCRWLLLTRYASAECSELCVCNAGNLRTTDKGGPYNLTLLPVQINEIKGALWTLSILVDRMCHACHSSACRHHGSLLSLWAAGYIRNCMYGTGMGVITPPGQVITCHLKYQHSLALILWKPGSSFVSAFPRSWHCCPR